MQKMTGLAQLECKTQDPAVLQVFEKRPPPDYDEKHHGSRSIVFGLLMRGQQGFQKVGKYFSASTCRTCVFVTLIQEAYQISK